MKPVRPDFYTPAHKALRYRLCEAQTTSGSLDWMNARAVDSFEAKLTELVTLLHVHHNSEDKYVHPLLDSKTAGGARDLYREHQEQRILLDDIEGLFKRLRTIEFGGQDRLRVALEFYRSLSRFVSGYLSHMDREEAQVMTTLWQLCTDEELGRTQSSAMGSWDPDLRSRFVEAMTLAMSPQEITGFLTTIKRNVPATYEETEAIAKRSLGESRWHDIEERLKAA